MTEEFKYKGEFYLPHDKKNTVRGTLIFEPEKGIELDLIGSFGRTHNDKQEIIWGILENGKPVTLYNSFITSKQFSFTGFAIDKYVSNFVFFDIYFNNKNDLKFSKVSTHYSHLDEWLNIRSGFKIDHDLKNYKVKIEYELPSPINVSLPNNLELTINLTAKGPSLNLVQKDALIKQKAFINFETPRKRSFDKILEEIFHFQNFLTLVTQRPIYIKELYGYLRIGNKKQLHKSKIIFKVYNIPKNEKELIPMDMLIPFGYFSNSFNAIIANWFFFKNQLETATDPFFSTYYNPNLYTSDKFLNLIRSMEAFHRDNIQNNATNRDRFLAVLKEFSIVYNWLLKIKSKPKYVGNILKHRNDFTHSNPVIRSKDKKYLELHYISEQLKIIMSCALLHKIGFSKKDLKRYLNKTILYTHIKYKMK
jgi:hypothetical protein